MPDWWRGELQYLLVWWVLLNSPSDTQGHSLPVWSTAIARPHGGGARAVCGDWGGLETLRASCCWCRVSLVVMTATDRQSAYCVMAEASCITRQPTYLPSVRHASLGNK